MELGGLSVLCCVGVEALTGLIWGVCRGDEEEGSFYCLLMRAFDVAPVFAVCTPGPLLLHPDWLCAGGGGHSVYFR